MKLSAIFVVLLILDAITALGQQQQEQQGQNPFVFQQSQFQTGLQGQHGSIRVLPRFSQRSEIFRGIDNYLIAVFEAEPNTFFVPCHLDAEVIAFVRQGNGAVSLLFGDRRESFEIRTGDIFRLPAGIERCIVNKDNNQKLVLVDLIQPIANSGQFEAFLGGGAESPGSSFYKAFSNEVLEAVFQERESEISRIIGQKRQEVFVKASQEQISELIQHQGSSGQETLNIFDKRPVYENQFGQLREVNNKDDFQPLQELDVAVTFANITRGGMAGPVYNSKAWQVAVIVSEDGYLELAHPEGHRSQGEPGYQRVCAQLRQQTVVIVPPGHPAVFVAPNNRNLEIVSFEINAIGNEKIPLAGRGNVYNQLERVAKELAFGASGREVEELFNRNKEQLFFRGPQQHGGGGESCRACSTQDGLMDEL